MAGEIVQQSVDLAPEKLTKRDVGMAWLRFYFANEIPHSYTRYIAPALMWALMPVLKKLYKNKEDLAEALARHLLFFNTQLSWGGGTITGIVASLEEVRAQEVYEKKEITIDDDLIYNTKAGLMGALAGIGDSIDSGTIQYIFIAIALPWAKQGNALGALFPFVCFALYQLIIGYYFAQLGYKLGRNAATEMVGSRMKAVIDGLSILGLFMMGILASSYISVKSGLTFSMQGKPFVIQSILDSVLPGLLPLLTVGGVYFYLVKRGLKILRVLIYLTIILAVLALIGIL
jgi:PTS system mannose-specific IID component